MMSTLGVCLRIQLLHRIVPLSRIAIGLQRSDLFVCLLFLFYQMAGHLALFENISAFGD